MRKNAPDPVSCVLLAQLAVDTSCQRRGIARALVLHAIRPATRIADLAGCRLFAVSPARPCLVAFYGKFGFREAAAEPPLMAMSVHLARATFRAVQEARRAVLQPG